MLLPLSSGNFSNGLMCLVVKCDYALPTSKGKMNLVCLKLPCLFSCFALRFIHLLIEYLLIYLFSLTCGAWEISENDKLQTSALCMD